MHARASVFANVCTWQGGEAERYFETNNAYALQANGGGRSVRVRRACVFVYMYTRVVIRSCGSPTFRIERSRTFNDSEMAPAS